MDLDLFKLLAQFGISGILLGIVAWLLWRVGMRMIAAIDRVAAKVEEHTVVDVAHHAEVREAIVEMRSRIDVIADITPIEIPPKKHRTNPHGVPVGYYGPRRPTNKDDD